MNDFEASFTARFRELYPELIAVRNTCSRRTGVDCKFHYELITDNALDDKYAIYIEFWDDGTIWYSIEDDSDRYVHAPTPRHEIANPDFTVEKLVADIKAHIARMPSMSLPDSAIVSD